MKEEKVNLFVVGAMKAGTTSFVELLSGHDQIYIPPVKEPHFFVQELPKELYEPDRFFNLQDYLENKFPEPLHIAKFETEAQYHKLFSQAGSEKYRADASTAYLHAPEAASLIYDYNPDARVLILLRNPLKRAFSHYKMDLGKGRLKENFESSISKDINAYYNGNLPWYSHLGMSLYRQPIQRFEERFAHVLVIHFEDLLTDEEDTLSIISSFLDIERFDEGFSSHMNIARKPRFPKLFYFLKRLGLKDYFSKIFSSTFKQWLSRKTSSKEKFEMELSKATREDLDQIFTKDSQI